MNRFRGYTSPYIPGSYAFRYLCYNIFTGIRTERLKAYDNYPSKASAELEFYKSLSKWNRQAFGSIQYWSLEEK